MSKSRVLSVVIPAAGFGSRMGNPVAKEMLTNPGTGLKFVNLSLQQAKNMGAKIILITRKEKKELILIKATHSVVNLEMMTDAVIHKTSQI